MSTHNWHALTPGGSIIGSFETETDAQRWAARWGENVPDGPQATVAYKEPKPATPPQAILDFINDRTDYVRATRAMTGEDNEADYWRYQGHMEARRQLAQTIGYTVPYEVGDRTAPKEEGS